MKVRWYVTQQFYLYDVRFISSTCCKWHEFPFLSSTNVSVQQKCSEVTVCESR